MLAHYTDGASISNKIYKWNHFLIRDTVYCIEIKKKLNFIFAKMSDKQKTDNIK